MNKLAFYLLFAAAAVLAPATSYALMSLTQENFSGEVDSYQGNAVVVVSAKWCGPCKQLKPVLEQASQKYAGSIKFGAVDADQSRGLLDRFQVKGLPTVLFIKNGKVVQRKEGYMSPEQLESTLNSVFK